MKIPSDEEVQRRADEYGKAWYADFGGRGGQVVPPPSQFLVYLARLLDPAATTDQFWSPGESDDHETASGRVVLTTENLVFDVSYSGLPVDFYPGNPPPGEGRTLTFRKTEVTSVEWTVPRLTRPSGSLDPGEIAVGAAESGWTLALPTARMYRDGEGYFGRVLQAFGLNQ